MSDVQDRVLQFQRMVEADPENELGHFSLGKALLEAGQSEPAAAAFAQTLALNPGISKAHQHLAEAQLAMGHRTEAIDTLRNGYEMAKQRGDMMPARAMAAMLQELGAAVETVVTLHVSTGTAVGAFACRRCGGGEAMAHPPMRGPLGVQIKESICGDCWRQWIGMGTKVINELRLDFREPAAQEAYDKYMKDFLGLV